MQMSSKGSIAVSACLGLGSLNQVVLTVMTVSQGSPPLPIGMPLATHVRAPLARSRGGSTDAGDPSTLTPLGGGAQSLACLRVRDSWGLR